MLQFLFFSDQELSQLTSDDFRNHLSHVARKYPYSCEWQMGV